jgi:transcriptional regulator with XRE-family HTH domain
MTSRLVEKLRDPQYRKAFVASQINIGIPFQIRAILRNRPEWTQETLAERAGMLQPRISGLMKPGKTHPNIETLRRLAEAFDCGLLVRFAPFSELARWSEDFDPESFTVPDFEHDPGFIDRKPLGSAVELGARLFPRSEQPSLAAAQDGSNLSNLVVMDRRKQALAEQPSQLLMSCAGALR